MKFLILIIVFVVLATAYVRFAPLRLDAGFDLPQTPVDLDEAGRYTVVRRVAGDDSDVLARVTQIAVATPRTVKISDDPLRFVTRSRIMGFPDITTVAIKDGVLIITAGLVFGSNDLGVNKARVLAWLDQLGPL